MVIFLKIKNKNNYPKTLNPVHLGIKESNLTDQFSIFFAQSRAHPKNGTPHLRKKKSNPKKLKK